MTPAPPQGPVRTRRTAVTIDDILETAPTSHRPMGTQD